MTDHSDPPPAPNTALPPRITERHAFFIMRHGETTDNANGRISGGRSNPNITLNGANQASEVREVIEAMEASEQPTCMVVTGLERTHQTGFLAAPRLFDERKPEARLNERDLGELDGIISQEEQDGYKAEGRPLPREESSTLHSARVIPAMNAHLANAAKNGDIPLFVAHGGTTRRVFEALGVKFDKVKNATLYQCVPQENGGWQIFQYTLETEQNAANGNAIKGDGHRRVLTKTLVGESLAPPVEAPVEQVDRQSAVGRLLKKLPGRGLTQNAL